MQRQGNIKEQKHYKARHLKLNDLKQEAQDTHLYKKYLYKDDIPPYPGPGEVSLEFHVSRLKHDTYKLEEIKNDGGFKDPNSGSEDPDRLSLVWWSLAVAPEEIRSAESRLLEEIFPNRTEEQARRQQSFLWKFASSPAFSEKSRYGSYRFTFRVEEVLEAYSKQFCSGTLPVVRVLRTSLYRQEVMYTVLVHSSANDKLFTEYPILSNAPNTICAYRDGCFIWNPEAMCEKHWYELIQRREENLMDAEEVTGNVQFYVWDHVAIALHVEGGQVLKFDSDDLRKNLTFCERDAVTVPKSDFYTYEDAQNLVTRLWPNWPSPLEKEVSFQQRF
ncbi:uncharacterized protein LOC102214563 [Pundamilia nyererei]|uniref:Uncharacterized protein LOC102214563 n=1 Tax=Pundamilia nyererei TaxID=303518 RepID=A0A9Y6J6S2_9CICH|nr:PREDICTED: uncharacterized protein LOC102214563 [Pundamilia nyererei]